MPEIQFGLILPGELRDKQHRATYVRDVNRALEFVTGHFDSAWMVDHLQFGDTDVLEGMTTLAYFAGLHPQLKFGTSVLCQSFRSPALLAKMGATFQFLSEGRFILGLGAGWHKEEYLAYGFEFPPPSVRVEQLAETVQIIRRMWQQETVTFEGRHYRVEEARCDPRPDPAPPLMIGAFRPGMLRLTAQYADWWSVSSTGVAAYSRMADRLERYCLDSGRDPASIRRTWSGGCACAPTRQAAINMVKEFWDPDDAANFDFVGTPQELVEQMLPFMGLGVDYFMLDCGGFPDLTTLEMLVREVLPALRSAGQEK